MCAKLNQVLSKLIPEGTIKEAFKSSYYSLYYNRKHFKENGFYVYYKDNHFEYRFDKGVAPHPAPPVGGTGGIPLHGHRNPEKKDATAVKPWSFTFKSYENIADEMKRSLKGYLAEYSLRPGDTVIDCGAYIGEFTLYAAKAVGSSGKVIAFEPGPMIYKRLIDNIELNGLKNVTVINKGLWSKDGLLKCAGDGAAGYSFVSTGSAFGVIEVPVASLDSELARLGVSSVDFIKVDVEGSELEFIKGAEQTLESGDVRVAIASYHIVDGKKSCFELEKMLTLLGYSAHTGYPGHLTTYAEKM